MAKLCITLSCTVVFRVAVWQPPEYESQEDQEEEPSLKFLDFDLERVVRTGQRLMASEGREFDREEQVGAGGV